MKWRIPPRIKVMEALGTIADNRIKLISPYRAEVIGSDGKRKYLVEWDPSTNSINSTDNGSQLKGYLGYPAIAFLMLQGVLPYDIYLANKLAGIAWRRLNETYKNYEKVIEEITKTWNSKDRERLNKFVNWVIHMIKELDLNRLEKREVTLTDFIETPK